MLNKKRKFEDSDEESKNEIKEQSEDIQEESINIQEVNNINIK